MSAEMVEITLARLYTDAAFLHAFIANPVNVLASCDLTESERRDLIMIDKAGLILAARSFQRKRDKRHSHMKGRLNVALGIIKKYMTKVLTYLR